MIKLIIPILRLPLIIFLRRNRWYQLGFMLGLLSLYSISYIYIPIFRKTILRSIFIIDSLSSPLIVLTIWIIFIIILASSIVKNNKLNRNWFLLSLIVLLIILVFTFIRFNLVIFYIIFEASLIPTIILIIGWGYQPERLQASIYILIYTISASLPLLIGIIIIYNNYNSLSLLILDFKPIFIRNIILRIWWVIIIMAFMVKIPLYLSHLWLPKAHVEAPVAGSIILAGVLLKLGGYGLLRLSFIYPFINFYTRSFFLSIALWGACATGIICLRQTDIKSLIAYSRVGHIGLLVAGACSCTEWGWSGALIIIISHGLCSSGIFSIANIIYEYRNRRRMILLKGLLSVYPFITLTFFILSAANIAAPPFINLAGEIILLTRVLSISPITCFYLGITRFLAAAYSLYLFRSIYHGQLINFLNSVSLIKSLNLRILFLHILPLLILIISLVNVIEWF